MALVISSLMFGLMAKVLGPDKALFMVLSSHFLAVWMETGLHFLY